MGKNALIGAMVVVVVGLFALLRSLPSDDTVVDRDQATSSTETNPEAQNAGPKPTASAAKPTSRIQSQEGAMLPQKAATAQVSADVLRQLEELLATEQDPAHVYNEVMDLLAELERSPMVTDKDPYIDLCIRGAYQLAKRFAEAPELFAVALADMSLASSDAAKTFAIALAREGVRTGHVSSAAPDLWASYQSTDNHKLHRDIVRNLHTWGQDASLIDLAFEEAYFSRLPEATPDVWEGEINGQEVRVLKANVLSPNYPGLSLALKGCAEYMSKWPEDRIAKTRLEAHLLDIGRDPRLDPREMEEILTQGEGLLPGFIKKLRALRPTYTNNDTQARLQRN